MKFFDAYCEMLKGKKIARPGMKGYWYISGLTGQLTIVLGDGSELTKGLLDVTVINSLAEDWFVVEE